MKRPAHQPTLLLILCTLFFTIQSCDPKDKEATKEVEKEVVIESEKQVIGILVDSVAEVVYLKGSEIDIAPNVGNEESAQFIQGVSNREGELLILVDLDKLLSDDEWDELKEF